MSLISSFGPRVRELRRLMQRAEAFRQQMRGDLRQNYTNTRVYTNEPQAGEDWAAWRLRREQQASCGIVIRELLKQQGTLSGNWSTLRHGFLRSADLHAGAAISTTILRARTGRVIWGGRCPLCGEHGLAFSKPAEGPLPICSVCMAAGAVNRENTWFKDELTARQQLNYVEVKILGPTGVAKQDIAQRRLEIFGKITQKSGDQEETIYYSPDDVIQKYHTNHSTHAALDSHKGERVGFEAEFHAGSLGTSQLNELAARLRVQGAGALSVEKDSSVTGFEVITGYGRPSTLREKLLVPWTTLLDGSALALDSKTGAHVHVSRLQGRDVRVADMLNKGFGFRQATVFVNGEAEVPFLSNLYRKLAGRAPNVFTGHEMAHTEKYSFINVRDKTYEFRLFKNPGSFAKFLRNAEFAMAATSAVRHANPRPEVDPETGLLKYPYIKKDDFLQHVADLPREDTLELRAWLAANKLKVPVVRGEGVKLYKEMGAPERFQVA